MVLSVLVVDIKNNCIDLSRKILKVQEVKEKEEFYAKSKFVTYQLRKVHLIMKTLCKNIEYNLEQTYKEIGFLLYRSFEHAYDGLTKFLE